MSIPIPTFCLLRVRLSPRSGFPFQCDSFREAADFTLRLCTPPTGYKAARIRYINGLYSIFTICIKKGNPQPHEFPKISLQYG